MYSRYCTVWVSEPCLCSSWGGSWGLPQVHCTTYTPHIWMNLYTYTIHRCTTYTPSTAICTIHFEIYTKHQYALYNCMHMCTFTSLWPLHWSPTGAIPSVHWSPIQTHHKLLYVPHISNTQLNPFFSHSSIHRRHASTRLQTAGGSKHIAAQSTSNAMFNFVQLSTEMSVLIHLCIFVYH